MTKKKRTSPKVVNPASPRNHGKRRPKQVVRETPDKTTDAVPATEQSTEQAFDAKGLQQVARPPSSRRLKEMVKEEFRKILVGDDFTRVGVEVDYDALIERANRVQSRHDRGQRWVEDRLREVNRGREWDPSLEVKVGRTFAVAHWVGDRDVYTQRSTRHPDVKCKLAAVLWYELFEVCANHEPCYTPHRTAAFDRKRISIRRKSPISAAIDAGTTNLAVVEQLLEMRGMPLQVPVLEEPKRPVSEDDSAESATSRHIRPVSFQLITNSWPIVARISEHQFSTDIGLMMIGGNVRPGRRSICGAHAQSCLDRWNVYADLAVIGATGYRLDFGSLSFACDSLEEAQLKQAILNRAWLRVLIFDSSKLVSREVSKAFCPLSPEMIDLAVTDDGVSTACEEAVTQFCRVAAESGVATAILRSPHGGKNE